MSIQVKNIYKHFQNFTALDNINLDIHSGELIALLGPSGSGKTTLLRIIAGLETPTSGNIIIDGEDSLEKQLQERKVGFVFQHYALFKHMTVFKNIAFGLQIQSKHQRPSPEEIEERAHSLLKLVHLERLYNHYPSQLSGGQRQRVALARALAIEPKILLLDEPFGALDAKVRKELRRWMRRLHDEMHITSIFVTHDQEEAMEVADRVVIMHQGQIEQIGTPAQVYHEPQNAFVYDFLGNFNMFEGWRDPEGKVHLIEKTEALNSSTQTANQGAKFLPWWPKQVTQFLEKFARKTVRATPFTPKPQFIPHPPSAAKKITVFARPHDMDVTKTPDAGYLTTKVIHINPAGALVKLELERVDGSIIQADITKELFQTLQIHKNDILYTYPKEIKIFE